MSLFRRIGTLIGRRAHPEAQEAAESAPSAAPSAPREAINDAQAYGVDIVPAAVSSGGWYWQAVRVHHLTPEENGGNHHLYVDVLDPGSFGQRVIGSRVRVTWEGGEQLVTVDGSPAGPGASFPMWRWQVCAVEASGLPGEELPSDRVTGMHTGHPDEAPGNTLFHHSFRVTFLKVHAPEVVCNDSAIYGILRGAGGRTVLLQSEGTRVASRPIAADEAFRFTDLAAGDYAIAVEGTRWQSEPIRVNGRDQVQLDLAVTLAESTISGRVRHGAGWTVVLVQEGVRAGSQAVAPDESYTFVDLPAGTCRVAIQGTQVISSAIALDGANHVSADLVAPTGERPLTHYVLFGSADRPATRVNLLLAHDYLLAFGPTFGFDPREAKGASSVTIIADQQAVSAQIEADLASGGIPVQRIAGSVEEVITALAARVAAGQPF